MKILMHNLYEGVPEKERFEKIIHFVKNQNPDVLGLLELNGWDKDTEKLNKFINETGFKHHVFCKTKTGYHTCLFSKKPFTKTEIITEGLWHGAIFAEIENMQIILVHLCPKTEDFRLQEIDVIFSKMSKDKEAILIGDVNSLSPYDSYSPDLIDDLKKIGLKKFGENSLRFDVTSKIKEKFIDVLKIKNKDFIFSVPSNFNKDADHAAKLRLDYCFATSEIARRISKAEILVNDETHLLSDHFPLLVNIDYDKRLRLGIDMDGVLADTNYLKKDYVKKHHGLIVDDRDVSKSKLSKIIGMDAYMEMINNIYVGDKLLEAPVVKNAKKAMAELSKVHDVIIITNRSNHELPTAKKWLKNNNIIFNSIINTSGTGKHKTCTDFRIDCLLDDNPKELESIKNNFTQKFLLMRAYNEDVDLENKYLHADDWNDFLNKILNNHKL